MGFRIFFNVWIERVDYMRFYKLRMITRALHFILNENFVPINVEPEWGTRLDKCVA